MSAISVIIPCYNCSAWLEAALRSVYAQTFTDWEIVAVDDGSSDSTLRMLRRHAQRDARVKVVKQNNEGVSVARNTALAHASGDYLFFLDSDDLVPRHAFEVLHATLLSEDAGIVDGRVREFEQEADVRGRMDGPSSGRMKHLTGHAATEWSLYRRRVTASMSGKLYRRELFEGITFPPGEIYEDLSTFYKVALRAEKYVLIGGVTYLYRQRAASQIHVFNAGRLKVLDVTRRIQENLSNDPVLLSAAHDRRLSAAFNMLGLLLNDTALPERQRTAAIMQCRAIIRAFRRQSLTDPKSRLRNRLASLLSLLLPPGVLDTLLRRLYR